MGCPKCEMLGQRQVYISGDGDSMLMFDKDMAARLAANMIPDVMPEEVLFGGLYVNEIDVPEHIDHVTFDNPIIFGTLPDSFKEGCEKARLEGQLEHPGLRVLVFIDGTYRAAKALRDKLPINGVILSETDTLTCLMGMGAGKLYNSKTDLCNCFFNDCENHRLGPACYEKPEVELVLKESAKSYKFCRACANRIRKLETWSELH